MCITLLPHNQMLFDKIVNEVSKGAKSIFYSEGTGLGKSYVFMALVQEFFKDKRVLYIVPKIAIFSNLEHYTEYQSLDADITYMTFAAFNRYEDDDSRSGCYDVVFIDECHHMLSDIQGANVYKFMQDMLARGKYCFGMTATPCYNGVFVDEKYFDVSCYGYDVFEAIDRGLMPKIDVALANIDTSEIPDDVKVIYSITGTKTLLEAIIEKYEHVTHWLAYFATKKDLESNVAEMRKLFPDFKILKLYMGTENPDKVIKEFEESDGKVVLMSVSMLLEGMHLDNVGGVLLYRNVIRNSTYFQIYGRLCRLSTQQSPVLVDISNSVMQLADFPVFKSSRSGVRSSYSKKDIFDVYSYGYKLLELAELAERFKVKEYRGIRWTSAASLAQVLHVCASSVYNYVKDGNRSERDYIDYMLKDSTYADYVSSGYQGYYVHGKYRFADYADLARQLKAATNYSTYLRNYPDSTLDAYINWAINSHVKPLRVYYKGVEITTRASVAEHFQAAASNVSMTCKRYGWSLKEYVDDRLANPSRYVSNRDIAPVTYRGVNIARYSTIASYFGVTGAAVRHWVVSHNASKEAYVDLKLDHPES